MLLYFQLKQLVCIHVNGLVSFGNFSLCTVYKEKFACSMVQETQTRLDLIQL